MVIDTSVCIAGLTMRAMIFGFSHSIWRYPALLDEKPVRNTIILHNGERK